MGVLADQHQKVDLRELCYYFDAEEQLHKEILIAIKQKRLARGKFFFTRTESGPSLRGSPGTEVSHPPGLMPEADPRTDSSKSALSGQRQDELGKNFKSFKIDAIDGLR
ncbi:MAG: hypothetical protein KA436_11925 [Oligoflexales bacterium]|nr:hypothetical protein [Oligoflexales bacterium]